MFLFIKRNKSGFPWNQKNVTDSFPWSVGMEMKNAIHAICNPRACCVTTNHSKDQDTQTSQKKTQIN